MLTSAQLNTDVRDNMLETAPAKITTAGDLVQGTAANALARLAAVATGNVLLSGGVGAASAWGKVAVSHLASLRFVDLARNAAQSINTASATVISWDAENLDADAWWSSGSQFIPQAAGTLLGLARVTFAGSTGGTVRQVKWKKNGSAVANPFEWATPAVAQNQAVVGWICRSANGTSDYFEVEAYQDTGGALNVTAQVVGILVGA